VLQTNASATSWRVLLQEIAWVLRAEELLNMVRDRIHS